MEPEHPVLHAAMNRQRGLFTTRDAGVAGYSPTEVRRRVRSGRWLRVRQGVMTTQSYAEAHADATELHARYAVSATLVVGRPAALSHETAAYEHGIDVLPRPGEVTASITVPPRSLSRVPDVKVYRNTPHPQHIWHRRDAALTSPTRTVLDLARLRPFGEGVVAVDSALHLEQTTYESLSTMLADCEGWPGWRRAESVIEFADGRAESPLESLARVMCVEQELPPPEPQAWITDRNGVPRRGDLVWKELRTVAELDGRIKYTEQAAYGTGDPADEVYREKLRRDALEEALWEIVRLTWADIVYRPAQSANRLRAAFARSARRAG